jgi:DNA replication and repair protein RecF
LQLVSLTTSGFRNLAAATTGFSGRINLVLGANGQGKSNLLEAVAVLGNLRSFRSSRFPPLVRHGEAAFRLAAEVEGRTGSHRLEQLVEPGPPLRRQLRLDGGLVSVERYLSTCPVFALCGADAGLVSGPPALRRAYIDRFAFLLEPATLADFRGYRRTLRQRNAALAGAADDAELEVWDQQLAVAAARLVGRRRRALRRLEPAFAEVCRKIRLDGFPDIEMRYRAESWLNAGESPQTLEESYRERYNETRARDRLAGHTQEGPHRHDVGLKTGGRPVGNVLSTGQIKLVAAALRLAAVAQVEDDRNERLPVLFDDVDAELDRAVFERLGATLASGRQLFLSSARGELVAAAFEATQTIWMRQGRALTRDQGRRTQ